MGGGHDVLLRALLADAPEATGVLFDLPEVIAGAADSLADRPRHERPIQAVGGSFFDSGPDDGDLYLLAHVLHDWDDGPAAKILRNCHRSGQPGHTLAVVEFLLPAQSDYWLPFLLDLHMLVTNGGRERTADDFRSLLTGADYQLERIINLPGGQNILLARA